METNDYRWVSVAEAYPSEWDFVIITAEGADGVRHIASSCCQYHPESGCWFEYNEDGDLVEVAEGEKVTHWFPHPMPCED